MAEPSGVEFRVNNFDLLRIIAATQVLIFHSLEHLKIATPLWIEPLAFFPGVPIFFVISGYLVSASYERQDSILIYFKNRFLRIFPGLWTCIGVTVIVAIGFGYRFVHPIDFAWLPAQLAGIIYTPSFLKSFGFGSYNGALWTIPVELQFYVALTILYKLIKLPRFGDRGLLIILVAFVGIALLLAYTHPDMGGDKESSLEKLTRYTFVPSFYLFLLGVVLQRFRIYRSSLIAGKGLFWISAYVFARLIVPSSPALDVVSLMLLGISTISIAYTLPKAGESVLRGQDISYGVYIYHGLILNIMVELGIRHKLSDVAIVLLSAYAAGMISWIWVERPFLREKRKRFTTAPAQLRN